MTVRERKRRRKQSEQAGKSKAERRAASISEADKHTASILGGGKLLKFCHLKESGLVNNWTTLIRWIKHEGFPAGRTVGVTRFWFTSEVDGWLAGRPVATKPLKGRARDIHERAKRTDNHASAA